MGEALIIIIVLGVLIVWWLYTHPAQVQRWLARRLVKHLHKQAHQETQRRQRSRQYYGNNSHNGYSGGYDSDTGRRHTDRYGHEPLIPPEYAQDVEFTETRIYSSDKDVNENKSRREQVVVESQVSDVEWVEIRTDNTRKRR